MSVCTFFGHRDCYGIDCDALKDTLECLIRNGTDAFYVGHQGNFDAVVLGLLEQLKEQYPHIQYAVVLSYLPTKTQEYDPYAHCSMYPEGMEGGHPKFAIDRRNRWMLDRADICVCYVSHTWGGAYRYLKMARGRGKTVINLGRGEI